MLKYCAWHWKNWPEETKGLIDPVDYPMGEVEPLDNKAKTHGICDRCLEKQLAEINEYKLKQPKE